MRSRSRPSWNGLESLSYYRKMKKRAALGLSNLETTHRFLLWSLASGASVASVVAITAIRATGRPIMAPLGASIIACTTFVTTTCWCLAFFMPDAYRSRVLAEPPSLDEPSV